MASRKITKRRKAEGRLGSFLSTRTEAQSTLPLVHTTRAYSFYEMLDGENIEPAYCDIFKEDLIYLFYGRPAYRAKEGNNARLEFEWPVVFIFDPDKISSIKRVYPFDTGAFALRLYEKFFDKKSQLSDFELGPSLASARRLVGAFYRDNDEYYYGETRKNVELPHGSFEASGLHELARLPGVQRPSSDDSPRDERSSAIEIQIGKAIPLKGTLLAVIIPLPYLDDDEIKTALARWEVKTIKTYGTLHNVGGEGWVGQIYEVVRQLYKDLKLLK